MDPNLSNEISDRFSEIIDNNNETNTSKTTFEISEESAIDVSKCLSTKQLLRNAMQNLPKLNVEKLSGDHIIVLGSNSTNSSLIDKLNKCHSNLSADTKDIQNAHKWTQLKNSMTQRLETQIEQKWKQREIIEKIENEELDDLEDEEDIEEDIDEECDEEIDEEIDEEVDEENDEEIGEETEKNDQEMSDNVEHNNDDETNDENNENEVNEDKQNEYIDECVEDNETN